jgi:putative phage-type endonuclease
MNQGTIEWRQQRVGRVTASRVGAILGISPFTSRKALLKEMVKEAMGEIHENDAPPLRWGREKEPDARSEYQALYCSEDVVETGLLQHALYEWLAASPDGLVGGDGMLEIKCPYGKRDDKCPEFKSAKDQPSYWHQIQCQLYVADRKWCDLFQWNPHDHALERVERDPDWFESVKDQLIEFMAEFEEALSEAVAGGSDSVLCSDSWDAATQAYIQADVAEKAAKAAKEDARKALIDLLSDRPELADECIRVQRIDSVGSVSYSKMAKELAGEDFDDIAERFRGAPGTTHRITILGGKK